MWFNVLSYPIDESKGGQHSVDLVTQKIEYLGANKTGPYIIEADMFSSQNVVGMKQQRDVHLLTSCEYPHSCFSILDNGKAIVSDPLQSIIMTKLNPMYVAKPNSRAEVQGVRYEYMDFIVKIGTCIIGASNTFRGILVEVEYLPCCVVKDCADLIKEFSSCFLEENLTTGATSYLNGKVESLFKPLDVMQQYLEHFNGFRKGLAL